MGLTQYQQGLLYFLFDVEVVLLNTIKIYYIATCTLNVKVLWLLVNFEDFACVILFHLEQKLS